MWILLIPWLTIIAFVELLVCLLRRKWVYATVIFVFLLVLNISFSVYPVNYQSGDKKGTIAIMTFNIDGSRQDSISIKRIAKVILKENADVVFLAEDFQNIVRELQTEISEVYPYTTNRFRGSAHYVYSKSPIGISERLGSDMTSYLFHCTVAFNQDSLQLYGCHLASNNYSEQNAYVHPDSVKAITRVFQYFENVSRASKKRSQEVNLLLSVLNPKEKNVILGDFNDISGSTPLNMIEDAGYYDAWWKGGIGYGPTIHHPLPYRIDHIFYNDRLKLKSIRKVDSEGLSDHDALVAEFSIN